MKKYILPTKYRKLSGDRYCLLKYFRTNDDGTREYFPTSRSNLVKVTKIDENKYVPHYFFQCGTAGGAVNLKPKTRREIIKLLSSI